MNVRLGTARTITVGPVLDSVGAAKTDEVVGSILASKNGGDPAALDGSATLTHKAAGYYRLALTVNDISALGCMEFILNSGTNTMPIRALNVMTAESWDALYAAGGAVAEAGDEMDLVSAPNETAVAAIQNGLATAAKLLKYAQLLARSDPAITTDNATELGEINANGGSGAGDFAATTDSLEATQDDLPASFSTLSISAGAVVSNIMYIGGVELNTATAQIGVNVVSYAANQGPLYLISGGAVALGIDAQGKVAVPDTQKVDVETIKTRAVTCAAGVTVRADVGAAAAPGAANGMLIGGSNADTTFSKVSIVANDANGGLYITNSGGPGIFSYGTTYGLRVNGDGNAAVSLMGGAMTNADALELIPQGTGKAIDAQGNVAVSGTTTLTGAVQLGSTLGITGAVTLSSTLGVGAVTFSSMAVTGAMGWGSWTINSVAQYAGTVAFPAAWPADWNWSTYAGGDTTGTATLLTRIPQVISMSQVGGTGAYYVVALGSAGTGTGQFSLSSGVIAASGNWSTHSAANVWSVGTRALTDKAGFSLSVTPPTAAQVATALLTDLLAGTDFNTESSFGKLIKDYLNASITSRMATFTYTAPDNTNIGVAATQATAAASNAAAVKAVTDKLATTIVQNGAVYDFTAEALAAAPTGGGTALTAQQTRDAMKLAPTAGDPDAGSIDAHVDDLLTGQADIKGTGFVKDTNSLVNLTAGDAVQVEIEHIDVEVEQS